MTDTALLRRRTLGLLAAAGSGVLALPRLAGAQDFPNRAIRMIIPYPPGGASDVIARILGPHMTEALGQPIVIENRPGGNGGIAAEFVARSPADGYTLLMGNAGPNALNAAVYGARLTYDVIRDFTPISLVSKVPMLIASHPSVPITSLQEMIALGRARNGDLSFAHGGTGAAPHLTMEQLADMNGFKWTPVPFRGGALALTSVLSNQVPIIADTAVVVLPHVREGRLRGIAVTTAERIPQAPDLPTIAEQGFPGFEATSWGGVMGPANLPPPVLERLNAAVVRGMNKPEVVQTLAGQGVQVRTSTPTEFAAHIKSEVERWTAVVQKAGVKPD
ncbi:MAG: tripartite tricarboxylate transporter substrate binding protein [Acetobacteraceae bacterium]|nr:tripartite tricarboxylate transporter substrate binding protein [Acetobacteraceae bacterium]